MPIHITHTGVFTIIVVMRYIGPTRQVLSASESQQRNRQKTQEAPAASDPRPPTALSFKSDIYSFAIIAWEIVSLKVSIMNKLSYQ